MIIIPALALPEARASCRQLPLAVGTRQTVSRGSNRGYGRAQANQVLPVFACALNREHAHDPAAHKAGVDLVMDFLDPFCTRPNLLVPPPLLRPERYALPVLCCAVLYSWKASLSCLTGALQRTPVDGIAWPGCKSVMAARLGCEVGRARACRVRGCCAGAPPEGVGADPGRGRRCGLSAAGGN